MLNILLFIFIMFFTDIFSYLYNEYTLSIVLFNIILYVFILYGVFASFFYFDLRFVNNLSDLKHSGYTTSIYMYILLSFCSMAGIPPLLGFSGKLVLFLFFFSKSNLFIILFVVFFNIFALYFYIRNARFIVSVNPKCYFNIKYNYIFIDNRLPFFLINIFLLNILGFTCSEDLIIFCNNTFSYIF